MAKRKSPGRKLSHREKTNREIAYLEGEVKAKIKAGDCHELAEPVNAFLTLAGPLDGGRSFVVLRTSRGDLILTMGRGELLAVQEQFTDLACMLADREIGDIDSMPTPSLELH